MPELAIGYSPQRMKFGHTAPAGRERLLAFLAGTAIFLILHQIHRVTSFPWDARDYWNLSEPAVFFHYPKDVRGYFYPLLLLPAHAVASLLEGKAAALYPYRIFSAIVYGYTLTNVLPAFYVKVFGGKLSVARRLVVPVLIAGLFPGLIVYPLSDLPALLLLVGAGVALLGAKEAASTRGTIAWSLLAGFLAYGAYNTRTIYLFPLLCLLGAAPLYFFRGRPAPQRLLASSAFLAGLIIASVPQTLINRSIHGTWSPAVVAQRTEKSLFALQLMWGITIQRYETTIDATSASPSRYFMDRAGEQLFREEKLETGEVTIRKYASLVARHPVDFLGIYGRHFVNGLDLKDGEVYVRDAKRISNRTGVVNFLVVAMGALVALIRHGGRTPEGVQPPRFSRHARADRSWPLWLLLLILPVLAILPGAIETRFFLPLQALVYCTLAFNTSIPECRAYVSRHWLPALIGFAVLSGLFFAVSTNTSSAMQPSIYPPYRFGE